MEGSGIQEFSFNSCTTYRGPLVIFTSIISKFSGALCGLQNSVMFVISETQTLAPSP